MRTPPSDGPTTDAVWNMIVFRLMAFGRSSRGTSVGTSACRAGMSKAPTAAPSAASTYIGHTVVRPRNVSTASASATSAAPVWVISISFRRSQASATTPLIIEKIMIGTTRTRPTIPSARPLRLRRTSSETCHSSAAFCIIEPVNDASRPSQISRKLRCGARRTGRRARRPPWKRRRPLSQGTDDRVRLVWLLEERAFLGRQREAQRVDRFVEVRAASTRR